MYASYGVFGIAIRVEFTPDPGSPTCILWVADGGKLKISFNVGKHGAAAAGRFNSVTPISAPFICGDLLETFTCIWVRKAEERALSSGDGTRV